MSPVFGRGFFLAGHNRSRPDATCDDRIHGKNPGRAMQDAMRNSSHSLMALILFSIIIAAYAVMAVWYPVAYVWATYEDLYGEWAQTCFFALALLFSASTAITRQRQRLFFFVLAAACFYVVMEEISWGQRIFGYETPELLQRHNLQHETNLHNLLTGPINTWTKRVLEYVLAAGFVSYGLIYPLLIRLPWLWLRRLESRWLPAPPLYLWPYFVAAAYLELEYLNFNEAEIAELLIGGAIATLCGHYWLTGRSNLDAHRQAEWPAGTSSRLAVLMAALFGLAGLLSVFTTEILYRNPQIKAKTDNRLLNGYEKFADRYARYQHWQAASELYLLVHKAEPSRTSVMRRLADVYRHSGNIVGFNQYNQLSLNTLLAKQTKNPDNVSTNLALSHTYRQRGIADNAIYYLQRAHTLAKQSYELNPDSANKAYWLAKTYKEIGDRRNATVYYRRAIELEPNSTKYLKAYYAMNPYGGEEEDDVSGADKD